MSGFHWPSFHFIYGDSIGELILWTWTPTTHGLLPNFLSSLMLPNSYRLILKWLFNTLTNRHLKGRILKTKIIPVSTPVKPTSHLGFHILKHTATYTVFSSKIQNHIGFLSLPVPQVKSIFKPYLSFKIRMEQFITNFTPTSLVESSYHLL